MGLGTPWKYFDTKERKESVKRLSPCEASCDTFKSDICIFPHGNCSSSYFLMACSAPGALDSPNNPCIVRCSYSCTHLADAETKAGRKLYEVTQAGNWSDIASEVLHTPTRFGGGTRQGNWGDVVTCREPTVTLTVFSQQMVEEEAAN